MRLIRVISLEVIALVMVACAPPHSVKRRGTEVVASDGSVPMTNMPVTSEPVAPTVAADGTRCQKGSECKSGDCVDGFCCESACTGPCLACDNPGTEGQCRPVADGQDPDNECDEEPAASCGRDGVCDGMGACRRYKMGTVCGPGSCTGSNETAASTCDGNGKCLPGTVMSCLPAVCIDTSCGMACKTNMDCQTGFFCDNSTCRAQRAQGAACDNDGQCGTGHCADKVCCATACADKCYTCKATGMVGSCVAVADGNDPRLNCPVENIFTCHNAGGCNGRGACRLHVAGTPCSSGTTCVGTTLNAARACDGMGACKATTKSDCSPYACNGGTVCWTVCATNAECKPPHVCRLNHCE